MGCCQKKKSEQLIEKEESKEMQSNPDSIKLTYNDFHLMNHSYFQYILI